MSHSRAVGIIEEVSGTEIDPAVVEAFVGLGAMLQEQLIVNGARSLENLSRALNPGPEAADQTGSRSRR